MWYRFCPVFRKSLVWMFIFERFSENPWFGSSFLTDFPKIPGSEVLFWPIFQKSLVRKFFFVRCTDCAEKQENLQFFWWTVIYRFSEISWFESSILTDVPFLNFNHQLFVSSSVNWYEPVFRNSLIRKFNLDRFTVFPFKSFFLVENPRVRSFPINIVLQFLAGTPP